MFNKQFHHETNTHGSERFILPSMTEPDNAMSIPEIIARYVRGHGISVPVLPDTSDLAAREDGDSWIDDPDMFSEERQQAILQQQEASKTPEEPEQA